MPRTAVIQNQEKASCFNEDYNPPETVDEELPQKLKFKLGDCVVSIALPNHFQTQIAEKNKRIREIDNKILQTLQNKTHKVCERWKENVEVYVNTQSLLVII